LTQTMEKFVVRLNEGGELWLMPWSVPRKGTGERVIEIEAGFKKRFDDAAREWMRVQDTLRCFYEAGQKETK
jgi:hypothetical protein